ncbi:MAG: DUF1684 domain-containing protein [Dehalococcoidia bacterium]|nr:DUF1684 domain-containing protein [Dehalococcoidia bacterium]
MADAQEPGDPASHARALAQFRRAKDAWLTADAQSPLTAEQRRRFGGLAYYDDAPALIFVVPPEPFDRPEPVELATSGGEAATYERWARIRFAVDGQEAALTVYRQPGAEQFFLPFVDATAGRETYGAGRYLEVHELRDGRLLVDFNYAYNPYCAYNAGYSCPLPPAENRLAVAIRAGERAFAGDAAEHRHSR